MVMFTEHHRILFLGVLLFSRKVTETLFCYFFPSLLILVHFYLFLTVVLAMAVYQLFAITARQIKPISYQPFSQYIFRIFDNFILSPLVTSY